MTEAEIEGVPVLDLISDLQDQARKILAGVKFPFYPVRPL